MKDHSPSTETIAKISLALTELLHQSRNLARFYLDASRMSLNPAFGDLLEDYSASERVASLEFEELLLRAGAGVPNAQRAPRYLAFSLLILIRHRSRDSLLSKRLLDQEMRREDALATVQEDLQVAGADPEALQRLSEIRTAVRQRIALFQERLPSSR